MKLTTLHGKVVHGKGLGKGLGFPTANLKIARAELPPFGVYRVKVSGGPLKDRVGACNVGVRPTLTGSRRPVVEVHIPGFSGDLYGVLLTVSFLAKIRDEKKFPSLTALKRQIRDDIAAL